MSMFFAMRLGLLVIHVMMHTQTVALATKYAIL